MHLMDRFQPLLELYRTVRATGSDPLGVILERIISPSEAIINGRPTILAGTNNYLGLTHDPECIEAAVQALRLEDKGTTGSRIATAHTPIIDTWNRSWPTSSVAHRPWSFLLAIRRISEQFPRWWGNTISC